MEEEATTHEEQHTRRAARDRRFRLIAVIAILPIVLLGVTFVIIKQARLLHRAGSAAGPSAATVEVISPIPRTVADVVSQDAIIFPTTEVDVVPQQAGWLAKVNVQVGQQVKAGDPVAVLEPANDRIAMADAAYSAAVIIFRDYETQLSGAKDQLAADQSMVASAQSSLKQAKASYATAQNAEQQARARADGAAQALREKTAELERAQGLVNSGAMSGQELKQIQDAHAQAASERDQANAVLDTARSQVVTAAEGVDAAQAVLSKARAALTGSKLNVKMMSKKVAAQKQLVGRAKSGIDQARSTIKPVLVQSKSEGTVTSILAVAGGLVTPTMSIATIKRIGVATAAFDTTDEGAARFKQGMPAQLQGPPKLKPFPGAIASILPSPAGGAKTCRVFIEARDTDGRLKPGIPVKAMISCGRANALLIPATAVMPSDKGLAVWMIDDGQARLKFVKTVGPLGEMVAVVNGLNSGDNVVVRTSERLEDGMQVVTRPASAPDAAPGRPSSAFKSTP